MDHQETYFFSEVIPSIYTESNVTAKVAIPETNWIASKLSRKNAILISDRDKILKHKVNNNCQYLCKAYIPRL